MKSVHPLSTVLQKGRSPRGERGLKFTDASVHELETRSLPPRGAWIEITLLAMLLLIVARRSPRGERGLKFILLALLVMVLASLPPRGVWIEIVDTNIYY